jgi:mannitol-specific phosphotransferase system IIBC component
MAAGVAVAAPTPGSTGARIAARLFVAPPHSIVTGLVLTSGRRLLIAVVAVVLGALASIVISTIIFVAVKIASWDPVLGCLQAACET